MAFARRARILALLMAGILGAPAGADAQSPGRMLFGSHDFEMDWRLEPAGQVIRLRFLAAKRRLRIETLDRSEQVMIRDLASGAVVVLVAEGKKGAYGAKSAPLAEFRPESVGATREVAGIACRDFVLGRQTLCLTDDGIPVAAAFAGGALTAQNLLRQAQNAGLFDMPKDITLKPLPGAAAGSVPKLPF